MLLSGGRTFAVTAFQGAPYRVPEETQVLAPEEGLESDPDPNPDPYHSGFP